MYTYVLAKHPVLQEYNFPFVFVVYDFSHPPTRGINMLKKRRSKPKEVCPLGHISHATEPVA